MTEDVNPPTAPMVPLVGCWVTVWVVVYLLAKFYFYKDSGNHYKEPNRKHTYTYKRTNQLILAIKPTIPQNFTR